MRGDLDADSDRRLHQLLAEGRLSPPLPPRFREEVWRRIHQGSSPSPPWALLLDEWIGRLLRPRVAGWGLAALLFLASTAGVLHGTAGARAAAQQRYLAAVAPETSR